MFIEHFYQTASITAKCFLAIYWYIGVIMAYSILYIGMYRYSSKLTYFFKLPIFFVLYLILIRTPSAHLAVPGSWEANRELTRLVQGLGRNRVPCTGEERFTIHVLVNFRVVDLDPVGSGTFPWIRNDCFRSGSN